MINEPSLFDDEEGVINTGPVDETQITTTLLYFSDVELKEFKRLSKVVMKQMFGTEYQIRGNLSDMLLSLLRQYDTKHNPETPAN